MKEHRQLIYEAIDRERDYQAEKHLEEPRSVGDFILIMRSELAEAERAWNKAGCKRAIEEMLQVAATAVACMEQHGVEEEHNRTE
jgi:hypothetical protein